MKIKPYMEDFIRENYKTMTQVAMAKKLGENVTQSDISWWLKSHGLIQNKRRFSKEDVRFMIEHYQDMQYKDIAEHLGFTERQVRGKLNNMGYSKTRKFNKRYFHEIDSDIKAYLFGFIFADGYVVCRKETRNYEFAMQLQSQDKYILDILNKELGDVHSITHKNPQDKIINGVFTRSGHSDILRVYSKDIVNDLMEHGVVPDKTHNYMLPKVPNEYFFDFLRGYIDGDGCYYDNHGYIGMHITCSSVEILEWVKLVLDEYGISTFIYKEKDFKYRLHCTNKESVKTLVEFLYHDNFSLCLSRKYDKIKHLLDGRPN